MDSADWAPEPEEYALIEDEVRQNNPRVFALCELERDEDGDLVDGYVSAWGLTFGSRAHMVSPDGKCRSSFQSPEQAAEVFSLTGEVRLVWPGSVHVIPPASA